jgi:hypothetical protein
MSDLLTDNQKNIVLYAANEANGEIRWFPEHIHGGAQQKILQSLASKRLITLLDDTWRLTDLCYQELGLPSPMQLDAEIADMPAFVKSTKSESGTKPARQTKQQIMIDLLSRDEGASIPELMAATGWQQHTVRGALSGTLKKRLGFEIESIKTSGSGRTYRILKASD